MAAEPDIGCFASNEKRAHEFAAVVSAIAARQHGVVATWQLVGAGLDRSSIAARVRSGFLHRLHRGVYAVGHTNLTIQGRWMAAVLAGGPGAVLSHRPAGTAWNLRGWRGRPAITVPRWRRPNDLIEIHSSVLPADERTVRDGIPITSVPRTLLDLATVLDHDALVRALNEAEAGRLADSLPIAALLDRHRGERGAGALRRALADVAFGRGITLEELEERFAAFIRAYHLPPPLLNAAVRAGDRTYVADALWPKTGLIVELQSIAHHATPAAMSADADRTRRLTLAGCRVVYVTWAQLVDREERDALARDLWSFLGRRAGR